TIAKYSFAIIPQPNRSATRKLDPPWRSRPDWCSTWKLEQCERASVASSMNNGHGHRGRCRGGRAWAEDNHLEPFTAPLNHVVVALEQACQHAPQRTLECCCDAPVCWGAAVAHRILLAQCRKDLGDGRTLCFHAHIICRPLHANFGAGAMAMK